MQKNKQGTIQHRLEDKFHLSSCVGHLWDSH